MAPLAGNGKEGWECEPNQTALLLSDTPLHSSETPRSSSLYQPESDEEGNVNAGGGEAEEEEQEDDGGNGQRGQREETDISEDVVETEQPSSSSSHSASAEVLESEAAEGSS